MEIEAFRSKARAIGNFVSENVFPTNKAVIPDKIFEQCMRITDVNLLENYLSKTRLKQYRTNTALLNPLERLRPQDPRKEEMAYLKLVQLTGEQVSSRIDWNKHLIDADIPPEYYSFLKAIVHSFCYYPDIPYGSDLEFPYLDLWNRATSFPFNESTPDFTNVRCPEGSLNFDAPGYEEVANTANILMKLEIMKLRNNFGQKHLHLTRKADALLAYSTFKK
jgi:hypothetical protein